MMRSFLIGMGKAFVIITVSCFLAWATLLFVAKVKHAMLFGAPLVDIIATTLLGLSLLFVSLAALAPKQTHYFLMRRRKR